MRFSGCTGRMDEREPAGTAPGENRVCGPQRARPIRGVPRLPVQALVENWKTRPRAHTPEPQALPAPMQREKHGGNHPADQPEAQGMVRILQAQPPLRPGRSRFRVPMRRRSILRKRRKKKSRARGGDPQRGPNSCFANLGRFSFAVAWEEARQCARREPLPPESPLREIRADDSEGAAAQANAPSLPLSELRGYFLDFGVEARSIFFRVV